MIKNIVIISHGQQRDSATNTHVSVLPRNSPPIPGCHISMVKHFIEHNIHIEKNTNCMEKGFLLKKKIPVEKKTLTI